MEKDEEFRRAWESALRLLTYRERSRKELRDKLAEKEYSPEAVAATIEKLERLELIDDEKFARLWVNSRVNFKPRAAWLIGRELREKGIDPEISGRVLDEIIPPERERAAARELAERRVRHYRGEPTETARRKLFSYLARRGFSSETIRECLEDLVGEEEETE
jgi:regulatory protein